MPIFISQGRYTPDAIKGMVAKPEDREPAIRQLWEQAGAKLLAFYMTFGEYDRLVITEGEQENVTAALVAAAAGGSITDIKTITAMTPSDMKNAFAKAGPLRQASNRPASNGPDAPAARGVISSKSPCI